MLDGGRRLQPASPGDGQAAQACSQLKLGVDQAASLTVEVGMYREAVVMEPAIATWEVE